jgi:hypothetical protein
VDENEAQTYGEASEALRRFGACSTVDDEEKDES